MVIFACVRMGTKYPVDYVSRLRNMIARHYPRPHKLLCFTDQPEFVEGVVNYEVDGNQFPTWWGKMALFKHTRRFPVRCIYFDLDTVITGDLTPLVEWDGKFGICRNFTKAAGHASWPCNYGSCVMSIAPGFGFKIHRDFMKTPGEIIRRCGHYGDQLAIEQLYPNATYLQDVLPVGYIVGRREFSDSLPEKAAIMVFAGNTKPHNTAYKWVAENWK